MGGGEGEVVIGPTTYWGTLNGANGKSLILKEFLDR